jgi:GNAT superfamily N-acetyltransferase
VNAEGFAIVHACSAADMEHVRALFAEYQQWLNVDLCFQGFDDEAVAGTVGMWPLGAEVVEMKRLFVRPPWRGRGLGRRLAKAIVDEAKAAGYARMRLDSLERLVAARALYESMGFVRIPAYYDNPLDGVLFMQLDLTMASHGA